MVVACSIALCRTSLEPEKGAARSDNADEERLKILRQPFELTHDSRLCSRARQLNANGDLLPASSTLSNNAPTLPLSFAPS